MSKTVNEVLQQINEQAKQVMEEGCTMIEADGKLLCGVKTGTLRRSITHEVTQEGNVITGAVGSPVEYAPFHELHNPFLENAVDMNKAAIESKFQNIGSDNS